MTPAVLFPLVVRGGFFLSKLTYMIDLSCDENTYQGVQEYHTIVHDPQILTHELVVPVEVIQQLHTFLLPVNNDLVKVRSANLLGLNDQIIL